MQSLHCDDDPTWDLMRHGAETGEPHLASSLCADVLVQESLEETVSTVLANALHTETF